MNRRKFLQSTGAAVVGGVMAPAAAWRVDSTLDSSAAESNQSANVAPITAVVFDERYTDCKIFAAALVARGARPFAVSGDSAALWYGSLRAYLASAPGRVAGFTTESDRGVSQSCGRELNLELLYEGAHDCRKSTRLTHRLCSTANQDEIAEALRRPRPSWPASLADSLHRAQFPDSRFSSSLLVAANRRPALATTPHSPGHPGYLTSWLLGPSASS